jgi:3'(2'), 5'-bisphosphate nucleotidase
VALVSRSHMDPETERFLTELPVIERRALGSSLKFCAIAEGAADLYPRLAPTMEWDTAAGHAILAAAGGRIETMHGTALLYGKKESGFRNEGFVAWGASSTASSPRQDVRARSAASETPPDEPGVCSGTGSAPR